MRVYGLAQMGADVTDPSGEILDIAYADPVRAVAVAQQALADGVGAGNAKLYRALGVAQTLLGEYENALQTLATAREEAIASGDDGEHVLAVLAMAGPTTVVGTMSEASDLVDACVPLAGTPYLEARVAYQRGVLALRAGDNREAMTRFESALPALSEAGDEMTVRAALQSLGLLHMQAGDLTAAEIVLEEALAIAGRRGEQTSLSGITHNLGLVASYRGDIPRALELLTASDEIYMRLTGSEAPQHVARAEVLLSAGLFDEALHLAKEIAQANRSKGDTEHQADALVVAARAALLGDRPGEAGDLADSAVAVYRRNRRSHVALEAEALSLDARSRSEGPSAALLSRAQQIVDDLMRERQLVAAAETRLLVARLALGIGEEATAAAALRPVAALETGPVEARVRGRVARARLRLIEGDRSGAAAAALSGLRLIDRYQAMVGATDLRMGLEGHGVELGDIGMDLAIEAGEPRRLLRWMERTRARALRHRPVSPDEGLIGDALARLRQIEAELRDPAGGDTTRLAKERRRLQEQITTADRMKRVGTSGVLGFGIDDLIDALGDRTLYGIALHRDRLHGVVVSDRRARRVELGSAAHLGDELAHLRFALRRSARLGRPVPEKELDRLGSLLTRPAGVGDREVVIVPPPSLMAIPWAALPGLSGVPLTVSPSAEMWWRANRLDSASRRVTVVGGPGLVTAADEVAAVASLHPRARVLEPGASVAAALNEIDGVGIAHIACHARFESQNPMFSALRLGDGDLYVYDLERMKVSPEIIVLSACDSGYTEAREGVELAGLSSALLSMGTRSIVASVGLVPDHPVTIDLMVHFHRGLRDGLSGPAALADARRRVGGHPIGDVVGASFLYVGG